MLTQVGGRQGPTMTPITNVHSKRHALAANPNVHGVYVKRRTWITAQHFHASGPSHGRNLVCVYGRVAVSGSVSGTSSHIDVGRVVFPGAPIDKRFDTRFVRDIGPYGVLALFIATGTTVCELERDAFACAQSFASGSSVGLG